MSTFGFAQFFARVEGIEADFNEAAAAGHAALAQREAQELRANCPVDTGKLLSTIQVIADDQNHTTVVVGDETTEYLGSYEFGNSRQPPRPFVRPAASQAESDLEAVMTAEARKRIK